LKVSVASGPLTEYNAWLVDNQPSFDVQDQGPWTRTPDHLQRAIPLEP
jgi:hypothetical protein